MSSDQIIDFTNPATISGCLAQHLQEPPKAWIKVQGFHFSKDQERVIDFDFKTKALNPQLLRIELRSNDNEPKTFSMDRHDSITSMEETVHRSYQAGLDLFKTSTYERIIIEKGTEGMDSEGIQSSLRGEGKRVVYGGNVDVEFYDTSSSTTVRSHNQDTGNELHIKAYWSFDWLGVGEDTSGVQRGQRTWSGRLQPAMVDGETGWISKDDPIPPGIHFKRALQKYNLVYETTVHRVNENGSSGTMRFHMWGCDE